MSNRSNSRKGVGGIIAGVILVGILLTSVLVYFTTIANNDQARTGYQLQALQENGDKDTESFVVLGNQTLSGQNLGIQIKNTGPIPMVASQMLLYCTDCPNPTVPIANQTLGLTLNAGVPNVSQLIGPLASGNTYRVDVISERGNIVSSASCIVELTRCNAIDTGSSVTTTIVNEGIIQGTGSVQLDQKAFGAIFPALALRGTVDQRGWDVHVASKYGNATGYPAFNVPYQLNTIYVEKFRNMDDSGQNLILDRDTLLSSINQPRNQSMPIDVVFAIDSSGSMKDNDPSKLRLSGAKSFIDKLDPTKDQAGIVSWDDNVDFTYGLTKDFATLKNKIDQVDSSGSTNLNVGLNAAKDMLDANTRTEDSVKAIIFLTDGLSSDGLSYVAAGSGGPAALVASKDYHVYSIGLGSPLVMAIGPLSDMATATNGRLFIAPTASTINSIYKNILEQVSVSLDLPDIEYICKEDKVNRQMVAYDEATNRKVLPATPSGSDGKAGWQEIYFCSRNPGKAGNDYQPANLYTSYHPLIMVVRGHFNNTNTEHGQTIPYQSSAVSGKVYSVFNSCIRTSDVSTDCPLPTVADNSVGLKYSAGKAEMNNLSVWVHVNTVTSPITVTWLYPDGNEKVLTKSPITGQPGPVSLNANKNLQIKLPDTNSGGICSGAAAGTNQYYTLRVTDDFDSQGRKNVYYMTFKVGC